MHFKAPACPHCGKRQSHAEWKSYRYKHGENNGPHKCKYCEKCFDAVPNVIFIVTKCKSK